jgi:SAM-dependent methyltransferase
MRKPAAHAPAESAGPPEYFPEFFESAGLESAKRIAITAEGGMGTEERWEKETAFMLEHIAPRLSLGPDDTVLDFGCGPGRMSRALIGRFGCSMVGVDLAKRMREQAVEYVNSPRFRVLSPEEFDAEAARGPLANVGLACWVLQHCPRPDLEIARLAAGIAPGGMFLLVNSKLRLIPTTLGWGADGVDVDVLIATHFSEVERSVFPPGVTSGTVSDNSTISWWRRLP